jgi:hypothetical protein
VFAGLLAKNGEVLQVQESVLMALRVIFIGSVHVVELYVGWIAQGIAVCNKARGESLPAAIAARIGAALCSQMAHSGSLPVRTTIGGGKRRGRAVAAAIVLPVHSAAASQVPAMRHRDGLPVRRHAGQWAEIGMYRQSVQRARNSSCC